MLSNQLGRRLGTAFAYLKASLLGTVESTGASLKHTVTIGKQTYASKYTVQQIRLRYQLKYQSKKIGNKSVYINKVWAYQTTAHSGIWDYAQPLKSGQVLHNGRFIVFRTWMGGNTSTLKYVSLDSGRMYTAEVVNLK
ncbi:hypothetical protein [Secundilactobacillus folii]|uniref:Uncharacterized protein n=1 Tax=Secundilactobacillus folii TaxID=2678357 RepID=A0A7X2XUV1_9LACO|nr:hypothetical protein [Secundilactobacillus folii]MTV81935.1 hypothetical protein [Secundilactobacillus folii]